MGKGTPGRVADRAVRKTGGDLSFGKLRSKKETTPTVTGKNPRSGLPKEGKGRNCALGIQATILPKRSTIDTEESTSGEKTLGKGKNTEKQTKRDHGSQNTTRAKP